MQLAGLAMCVGVIPGAAGTRSVECLESHSSSLWRWG